MTSSLEQTPSRERELTAYIGRLREALALLIDGIVHPLPADWGFNNLAWRVEAAQRLLHMETGRHAQADWDNSAQLNAIGSLLADYIYPQLYGTPRSPSGYVPTETEIREALAEMQTLIEQSWALEALLSPLPPREEP